MHALLAFYGGLTLQTYTDMLIARMFRLFFRIPGFKKHHFGLYKRLFKPFRLLDHQAIIHTYDGDLTLSLDVGEWIQQQIYFFGLFDERGIRFIKKQLKEGDVCIDIGANIGCYSLIASKLVGSQGHVFAFEPVRHIYERLRYHIECNNMDNVSSEKKAISDRPGKLTLYVSGNNNWGMSSIFHHDEESGEVETVDSITIDDYVKQNRIEKITLIKIDIEGAELLALLGMKNTLVEYQPLLMMEISDAVLKGNSSPIRIKDEILRFLQNLGYMQKAIDAQGNIVSIGSGHNDNYCNYVFVPSSKYL